MHCGMCLPVCPTYDATRRERHSPRGRISLMRAVADGELKVSHEFAAEIDYCLGCLACQTACPAGVNYAELFETARFEVEQKRVVKSASRWFWRTLTLRFLFMRPRLLRFAGRLLGFYQRSGGQAISRKLHLTRLLPAKLHRLEPQTPTIARYYSSQLIASDEKPIVKQRYRVALLTGCVQDLVFSNVNRDTADVLLANGCAVHTPPIQPCCGSLHAHNGEPALAASLARRMIDLLPPENFDAIITNAGGCGAHLHRYGHLLQDDPHYAEKARCWDLKLRDIHEWLIEIDCRKPLFSPFNQQATVTYHDSCHLAHGQKITRQPRQLLKLLPEIKFIELNEANWCCGSAGVYNITQPDQSTALLNRKIHHIQQSGAEVLATANPGCHLQIIRGMQEAGIKIKVLQPVTLLAMAYRREQFRG
ncbi:MAG TPA: (Fe-S)-binding protein [Verrucomicrobiae bacterium]|nr:(Fe-S)-binding protein [Verrucomicrobiae bacterium]